MHSGLLKAASLALTMTLAAATSHAGVDVRAVSEQNGRVVVQFDNHQPPNFAPKVSFYVAISSAGSYSAVFYAGPAPTSKSLNAAAALDTLPLLPPFNFRGTRVLFVKLQLPGNTPVSYVVVNYTPAALVASASTADPLLKEMVVNKSVFPLTPSTGAPEAWFSRAAGWAKFSVEQRGMYAVTGSDLSAAGVNLSAIDPATLRLYSQGGRNQVRDYADLTGSWRPGNAMGEVSIRVEAGSDGTFDPGDRVVFYGLATRDWMDYYDATAPDSVYHEHTHAGTNYYYLGWGGTLPGTPARMSDVDAAPGGGGDISTFTQREYRERDLIADFDFRGDGWLWLDIDHPGTSTYSLDTVTATNLVTSVPQQLLSLGLAPYGNTNNANHHAVFKRGPQTIGGKVWTSAPNDRYYENGVPIRIQNSFLIEGINSISFQVPGDLNSSDKMLFAWYAVWYERRIRAIGDAVAFSSPDTTGAFNLRASGFSQTGTMYAFNLTDPWNPARLIGLEVTTAGAERMLRLGVTAAGEHMHFWAGTGGAFRKPGVTRLTPVELRADVAAPNMLIITHRDMRSAADRLRSFRAANHVPLYSNPIVKVVTTDEIYDNFSGGMPDPMAIRNYIKYLYDNYQDANGNPRLGYVLLLGDATEDFQNYVSKQPDYVPTNLYFTRSSLVAFSTDDWYGHLDTQDQVPGRGVLDVALGRLPAASADEASFIVDKVIAYETEAPRDNWRHRGILVADDEYSSFQFSCEYRWTYESEEILLYHAADFLDFQKIYLVEYPEFAGVKPTSRLAFLDAWNAGAMVINYIGHGSSVQMADEQVFLGSDVSQLVNGLRLPILMAFSCTIGDFANPAGKSLSEKLLLREGGGAIGTVTASQETYPDPNIRVCNAMYERMFAPHLGRPQPPLGVALMFAKLFGQVDTFWQANPQEENTWKYNLLADPAMRLATPRERVRFQTEVPDTLVAGVRHTIRGSIYDGDTVDTDFDGPVFVTVREPQLDPNYVTECQGGISVPYLLPGGPIYQGTVDATDGQFEVSFRVPRYAATGPLGYAGAYAHDNSSDAAASEDSLLVVVSPTLEDSLALQPVDGSPRVDLGFKSGLKVVKPGDTVRARVADGDGINILHTTNEGRQAILIDDLPVPIDVNEFFTFDHGGIDTTGTLLYPLPDLAVGKHRLVYKVSDSFGFTTLDTLQFDVTDPANYYAEAVFNYPNPFKDATQFLFRISNRASIKLELFTISGKLVRRLEETRESGEVWMPWDGRDGFGGDVANGSYLYVATIDFVGVDRPPVVLRGALSRIR